MFCSNCGAKINDDEIFCPSCGTKQPEAEAVKEEPKNGFNPIPNVPIPDIPIPTSFSPWLRALRTTTSTTF